MKTTEEIFVARPDAEVLASLVQDAAPGSSAHADAVEALDSLLARARIVDELPPGRVGMGCAVRYVDQATSATREVIVAHPSEADAASGRVSILAPIAQALLGRATGDVVRAALPGRQVTLEIVAVKPAESINDEETLAGA